MIEPLEQRRLMSAALVDTDSSLAGARDLHALTTARPLRAYDSLGSGDTVDTYRFSLAADRNVAIKLDLLSANLNLQLLDGKGSLVAQSVRSGATREFISTRFSKGNYFLCVVSVGQAASTYRLNVADSTEQTFFALAAQALAAPVAGEIFLRVPSANGDASNPRYLNWIDISAYSWGVSSQPSTGGSTVAPRATFQELGISKFLDRASVRLFVLATAQTLERSSFIAVFDPDTAVERLRITFGNVAVTEFSSSQSAGSPAVESVRLSFQTIRIRYTPVNSLGVPQPFIEAGWNLRTNKAI